MGAGCSKRPEVKNEIDTEESQTRASIPNGKKKVLSFVKKISNCSIYHDFQYNDPSSKNHLVFTQMHNYKCDFTTLDEKFVENTCSSIYKSNGITVGYVKGYKLDVYNQDKFFVLFDGSLEIYCLLDGHGPYGNIIAQIIQDKFFRTLPDLIQQDNFDNEYDRILKNLFEKTNETIEELKHKDNYNDFLSGAAVTLLIKKEKTMYCANVGNVFAFLMCSERDHSYKYKIINLTIDDSDFTADSLVCTSIIPNKTVSDDSGKKASNQGNIYDIKESVVSIYENFDIKEELRRIYECGGEIRKLAGEEKSRIFVKGKYFPGLINTRSIGDQIGASIGIICSPHVSKYNFTDNNYYLVMCTDGIRNVLKTTDVITIIDNNDILCKIVLIVVPLESITSILNSAKQEYKKSSYIPDMTIILRTFNKNI